MIAQAGQNELIVCLGFGFVHRIKPLVPYPYSYLLKPLELFIFALIVHQLYFIQIINDFMSHPAGELRNMKI